MKTTEAINKNTQEIDLKTSSDFVGCYLEEDKAVNLAIANAQGQIAKVLDLIFEKIKDAKELYEPFKGDEDYSGPRIFYVGAGTSGRLGVLDASECPPTFSAHPKLFNGVIAGGEEAIRNAVEGAEDNAEAARDYVSKNLSANDVAIGISANGNAPYVDAFLEAAKTKGALTIAIANNPDAKIFTTADAQILLETGPEIITGSTRLKAGTAQKTVLNIISTGIMVKFNKVYGNLMVDLQAKNKKLKQRAFNLVQKITGAPEDAINQALEAANFRVKEAVIMVQKKLSYQDAYALLKSKDFKLRGVLTD